MAAEKNIQRRVEARAATFDGTHAVILKLGETGQTISVRPVDVSGRGLGFISQTELRPGSKVHLLVEGRAIRVEIAYCASHLGIEGLYRCGLFTWEPRENLERIFRNLGFLEELEPRG